MGQKADIVVAFGARAKRPSRLRTFAGLAYLDPMIGSVTRALPGPEAARREGVAKSRPMGNT